MRKNILLKICTIIFLVTIAINFLPNYCYAEVNTLYGEPTGSAPTNEIPPSVLLEWISSLAYGFGNIVEGVGATLMGWFTGVPNFPWADKIIYNATPILDINFINPAKGSLFRDINGNMTDAGNVVRNTYFSCLAIALGFLGLIVAVTAIRLAFSTLASEQAKYKQAIANTLMTLILLFGMHFILSGIFYLNEQMVVIASDVLLDMFAGDKSEEVIKAMDESLMKDDKTLVNNFFEKMGPNWLSPLTWVKETLYALADIGQKIYDTLCAAVDWVKDKWNSFGGKKDDEDDKITLDPNDSEQMKNIESIYPSRKQYTEQILKNDKHIHIAAFLLRDENYRDIYLKWAEGSDMDSFDKNGLEGAAVGLLSMVNDFFNIIDTGYLGIRQVYYSVFYIENGYYPGLLSEFNVNKDESALSNVITSTDAYNKYIVHLNNKISDLQKQKSKLAWTDLIGRAQKDNSIKLYKTNLVFAQAYYKFLYDGDDKEVKGAKNMVSELSKYFKQNAKYVDLEAGDWAPTSTSIPFGLLYAIFVIQSLFFLFSYIKRLFYVIILSVISPIVIVFDYLSKAI